MNVLLKLEFICDFCVRGDWLMCKGRLNTRDVLSIKGIDTVILYRLYDEKNEFIEHLFLKCYYVKRLWILAA